MATDYEIFYRENPDGLGEPTEVFVKFFKGYPLQNARILDVGCGQGRDALFIARLGHSVTGVDISPSGIKDMLAAAEKERLEIDGIVADIRDCDWGGPFDVIVIDRTLHMLTPEERISVLEKLIEVSAPLSDILIADEKRNLPALKAVLDKAKQDWQSTYEKRGFLFVKRQD